MHTSPIAESIATETARLAPIFRALLADPLVDPRRLDRAIPLVDLVERTARPHVWLVPSATDATRAYTVVGGLCSCADAQNRDARRCLHALAVRVYQMIERQDAEANDPTPTALALVPLPPIGITVRSMSAAATALADELFGGDAA